jgi:light-independent protochlorophyllide reductase subunit B
MACHPGRAAGAASYSKKENWGAPRPSTSWCAASRGAGARTCEPTRAPGPKANARANILGPPRWASAIATMSPRSPSCWTALGIDSQCGRPARRTPEDRPPRRGRLQRRALPRDREDRRALAGARLRPAAHQDRAHRRRRHPDFIAEVAEIIGIDPTPCARRRAKRLPWYSRSVDSTYLTGKRVFIFGDATHALAAARVAETEDGLRGRRPRHLQPRVRPRYPRRRQRLRRRAADHRRLPGGRAGHHRARPNWCSARRWSATSPSAWAFPAR